MSLFLVKLCGVLLNSFSHDGGASYQGKVVPEHLILPVSSESCLEIKWLAISGKR